MIEMHDWAEIVTFSNDTSSEYHVWEQPMFCEQVAQWFIDRDPPPGVVTFSGTPVRIHIGDPNLAMEFKLRWCGLPEG